MSVDWFRHLAASGRLNLFCFFAGVVLGFVFIRASVRLIRAEVRWWPGNVSPGGLHIHHVVFGVVLMLVGGVAGLAIPDEVTIWRAICAGMFGVGAALVLDEFALILHLDDVYWTEKGRTSIDAVFVAVALSGLMVLGLRPFFIDDLLLARQEGNNLLSWVLGVGIALLSLGLAMITLLKGKIWTGLVGLYLPVLLYIGAIRLARPESPWARWRYHRPSPRAAAKLTRATWRERRIRRPLINGKIWLQELLAGRHNEPH